MRPTSACHRDDAGAIELVPPPCASSQARKRSTVQAPRSAVLMGREFSEAPGVAQRREACWRVASPVVARCLAPHVPRSCSVRSCAYRLWYPNAGPIETAEPRDSCDRPNSAGRTKPSSNSSGREPARNANPDEVSRSARRSRGRSERGRQGGAPARCHPHSLGIETLGGVFTLFAPSSAQLVRKPSRRGSAPASH